MNLTTPPPGKLSDLIELAIADARKLDRSRYTPRWRTWHTPEPADSKCMVCLAGAIIAGTLGCSANVTINLSTEERGDPSSELITDVAWRRALTALEQVREGDCLLAFHTLHGHIPEDELSDEIEALREPTHAEFNTWKKLDAHLRSLAVRARKLRKLGV